MPLTRKLRFDLCKVKTASFALRVVNRSIVPTAGLDWFPVAEEVHPTQTLELATLDGELYRFQAGLTARLHVRIARERFSAESLFEVGASTPRHSAESFLKESLISLQKDPTTTIRVQESVGSGTSPKSPDSASAYANRIRQWLISKGVEEKRFKFLIGASLGSQKATAVSARKPA